MIKSPFTHFLAFTSVVLTSAALSVASAADESPEYFLDFSVQETQPPSTPSGMILNTRGARLLPAPFWQRLTQGEESLSVEIRGEFEKPGWGVILGTTQVPVTPGARETDGGSFQAIFPITEEKIETSFKSVSPLGEVGIRPIEIHVPGFVARDPGRLVLWQPTVRVQTGFEWVTGSEVNSLGTTRTSALQFPNLSGEFRIYRAQTRTQFTGEYSAYVSFNHLLSSTNPLGTTTTFPFLYWTIGARAWARKLLYFPTLLSLSPYVAIERQGFGQSGFGQLNIQSELNPTFSSLNGWAIWTSLGVTASTRWKEREFEWSVEGSRSLVAGATIADVGTTYRLGGYAVRSVLRADVIHRVFASARFQWITLSGDESMNQMTFGISAGWKFFLA